MASFGTGPFHSRPGLSSRSNNAQSDEIQLRVDPIHGDIDDTISDLHHKVLGLRNVAQAIESETKFQNDFLSQLEMTVLKAQAGVKNNMRRLNRSIIQHGSSHVVYVITFGLLIFFILYLLSKFSRR
ncbi:bet1-like protein At4g14600 isoform X1 [Cryptomeria japonica]|uniref:bet1-like protein At4g14600 isoform X1 n=1 Tax=Cryptomeria japonica TaxID=3369 RepID=UPI0025AC66F3|nr:bet1-like protein At4g14600 isoform X1 [Cryptomeria japonica]